MQGPPQYQAPPPTPAPTTRDVNVNQFDPRIVETNTPATPNMARGGVLRFADGGPSFPSGTLLPGGAETISPRNWEATSKFHDWKDKYGEAAWVRPRRIGESLNARGGYLRFQDGGFNPYKSSQDPDFAGPAQFFDATGNEVRPGTIIPNESPILERRWDRNDPLVETGGLPEARMTATPFRQRRNMLGERMDVLTRGLPSFPREFAQGGPAFGPVVSPLGAARTTRRPRLRAGGVAPVIKGINSGPRAPRGALSSGPPGAATPVMPPAMGAAMPPPPGGGAAMPRPPAMRRGGYLRGVR